MVQSVRIRNSVARDTALDWNRVTGRIKDHPLLVVLAFIASVVLPIAGLLVDWLSPLWAAVAISLFIAILVGFVLWPTALANLGPAGEHIRARDTPLEEPARRAHTNGEQLRVAVRRHILGRFGDKARLDYFHDRAKVEDHHDSLYREVIESLKDDPTWGDMAHAVDEWVSIGFETIVNWNSGWRNSGTLNQLYRAAYKELLHGQFPLRRSEEFAEIITSLVAAPRRSGH